MELTALDDMRVTWQQQSPPGIEEWEARHDWHHLFSGLRHYERRVLTINRVKLFVALVLLAAVVTVLLPRHLSSPLVLCGLGWMIASFCAFAVLYWRRQFRASTLPLDHSSLELITAAREGLERERAFFRRSMPLFGLALIVGLQILYLGQLHDVPWPTRLLFHVISIVGLAAALVAGLRFREWRFSREMQPLLDRLDEAERSLKGDER